MHKRQAKELIEALTQNERPKHLFLKEAMQTRGIIVSEYSLITKERYKLDHKTEAKIVGKLAKEVSASDFTIKAQQVFDSTVQDLQKSQNRTLDNQSPLDR